MPPTSRPTQDAARGPASPAGAGRLRMLWSREEVLAGIEGIAEAMVERFRDVPAVNLVPVLTGALQFAAVLSFALERRAPGKWLIAPVFAAAYAGDGELVAPVIEFPAHFEQRIEADAPAVIVDDLLDSGTTMAALAGALRERGLGPVEVCVLIERLRPREADVVADFCALRVDHERWLVGFGMDTGRRFRGFDAVYALDTGA